MYRSFRYRFYPTPAQEADLRRTIGCCRFVYNKALQQRLDVWARERRDMRYSAQSAALTAWKKTEEFSFLKEVAAVPLQQTLRHLAVNHTKYLRKVCGQPRLKRRRAGGTAEYTRSAFSLREGVLRLRRIDGPIHVRWSRALPAAPTTATVSLDAAGRWHVSLRFKGTAGPSFKPARRAVGLDLGTVALATLSTGEKVENPRFGEAVAPLLRRLHRGLSRKVKGSKNQEKARLKIARLHARVADQRRDYLHKLTTRLVRENQTIVVETLNVKGIMRLRRSMGRAVGDAGWWEVARQLSYKCEWYGRTLVKVDRFFPSSKTCSDCGLVRAEKLTGHRRWRCECGAEHDRDHNAAKNILAAGLAATGCGAGVSHRVLREAVQPASKQQPPP